MGTRIGNGDTFAYTPGTAVSAGDVIVIGEMVCVADVDIAANALGALSTEGIYNVACKSADVVTAGALLYWDATEEEATLTVSTNQVLGYATEAAGDTVTDVNVKLAPLAVRD